MIDSITGELTGVLDWAEGAILPFGLSLWGLESLLGYKDTARRCWTYYEQKQSLEELFWGTFYANVRLLSEGQLKDITVSRLIGIFLRNVFKYYGVEYVAKDENWDLSILDG